MSGFMTINDFDPGPNTIPNSAVRSGIDYNKVGQAILLRHDFGYLAGDEPSASKTVQMIECYSAGKILLPNALLYDVGTGTDLDFDIQKNGSTILSSPINLTDSDTSKQAKSGTFTSNDVAAGDFIEFILTHTSSTDALGSLLWCWLIQTLPSV